jgi:hypothetical protein
MKGFNFKRPSLETLKKWLPQRVEDEDYEDEPEGFATYADIEERTPVHHATLPSERAPAAAYVAAPLPSDPALHTVRIETDAEPELPAGTYDVHQPNINRTDLEAPDPEIDAVVAELAVEAPPPTTEPAPVVEPVPALPDPDANDLMSFFEETAEVSKIPTTLTESLPSVSASELLAEMRELKALLGNRHDAA